MEIELSEQEFRTLLHMAAIAQRVICMDGLLSERSQKQVATDELLEKLEMIAPDFGCSDILEEENGTAYLSEQYYDDVFADLDEYEEYGFYEKGAQLLAWRDINEQYTREEFESKTDEERRDIVWSERSKYLNEWEDYGCSRLRIVEG